jgi:hypothetical protein
MRHPTYLQNMTDWQKWRIAYDGGRYFKEMYLRRMSSREDDTDFRARMDLTYCPTHAKAAINDIKNSIFERMTDIARLEGPESFMQAMLGEEGGVDLLNNTMNSFIGTQILVELLVMGRVGVFVDMPRTIGVTLQEKGKKHPYLYMYRREQILNWTNGNPEIPTEVTSLLLQDNVYSYNTDYWLPTGTEMEYRLLTKVMVDGRWQVRCDFFDNSSDILDKSVLIDLPQIPFVFLELPDALMKDVCDYQIALLNIESSDINYILKANFPFYVEQYNPLTEQPNFKPTGTGNNDGTNAQATDKSKEVDVGVVHGRRVPIGSTMPEFIHPSSEPLLASISKATEIKKDIRRLINLAVSDLSEKMASAQSKQADNRGLESGLSLIGLILEKAEKEIVRLWSLYEGTDQINAIITYPRTFSLKTDAERITDASKLEELAQKIPSETFKRRMLKGIATTLLSGRVCNDELEEILAEIDDSPFLTSDPETITQDIADGLVSLGTASQARGYRPDEVEKAAKDHAERLARIAVSQGGLQGGGAARGLPETQVGQQTSAQEKQGKQKRGEGKQSPSVIEEGQ